MKNLRFLFVVCLLFFVLSGHAQIITAPSLPVASQKVTITFDSSKESRLGKYTGDLYAHTGVFVEGKSDWQHVIGTWGNNTVQPKLTNKGNGIYEFELSPNINTYYSVATTEKVTRLAFVFRSADATKQTNNLYVDVYQEGLLVNISSPSDNAVLNKNQSVTISANASQSGALSLWLDDTQLAQVNGTEISTSTTFSATGNHWLIAKVIAGSETKYDSIPVYIKQEVVQQTKPASYKKGINYLSDQSVALVLWAPDKEFVYVLGSFNDWKLSENYQMKKDGDYFWIEINGLTKEQPSVFQYYIDGKIKVADPYCEQISDPWNDKNISAVTYPGLVAYPQGKTEGIASVFQTGQTKYSWQTTNFQVPDKKKLVIYELLVRDFTTEHSFKAVREKLDYLEDLNINVLELMPVNEFEGNSSWGYNPAFYFAPDKYYGPKDELKKLVDECHKRGIAVVIDMVLNHSYGQSPFFLMYTNEAGNQPAANNPWYNVQHNFQNTSAQWGYDFNHESIYTRELVDSINSYWMSEYKVDGFRFDFTKGFSNTIYGPTSWGSTYDQARIANLKRMANEIWKRKSDALVIFEHLADNSEEKELAEHGILLWGNMNGNYSEAAMGYNENGKSELKGAIYTDRNWPQPNLVAYMESHDEERLMYKNLQYGNSLGSYSIKNLATALDRIELNAVFFIPLPGPKMIWQFGEIGYDYSIDSNGGRLSEKPVRWDYLDDKNRTDLFRVFAQLNHLKQTYDEFTPEEIQYNLSGEIKTYQMKKGDNYVVAVGNFGMITSNASITLPQTGKWFDYFAQNSFSPTSKTVSISLKPGEFKLYSTREMTPPHIVTSIEDEIVKEKSLRVFPNPCNDVIHVFSDQEFSLLRLISSEGKTIQEIPYSGKSTTMNMQHLRPGFYFLHIQGDDPQVTKIIKR